MREVGEFAARREEVRTRRREHPTDVASRFRENAESEAAVFSPRVFSVRSYKFSFGARLRVARATTATRARVCTIHGRIT